jgi:hypothetical protein
MLLRQPNLRRHRGARSERGIALLLTLFVVLIVAAIVMQLAVATSSDYAVSSNLAVSARLDGAADCAFVDARKQLVEDAQASAQGGQGGPMGGAGSQLAGGGPPDPSGGQQPDDSDSMNDTWAHDQETVVGDVQVRVHVEDENRKFNLLTLVSNDQDFARASRERLVRIIDRMREFNGSQYDLNNAEAETIAANIQSWLEGQRRDFDRPALLSNKADNTITCASTIDEMLLVEGVNEFILYDQKVDGFEYPGLASVLTVWTSLEAGPIKKDGESSTPSNSQQNPASPTPEQQNTGGTTEQGMKDSTSVTGKPKDPATASGRSAGVKININTASPAILRSLLPSFDLPTDIVDAIIKYRNQLDEEKMKASRESGEYSGADLPPGVDPLTKLVDRTVYKSGEGGPPTNYFRSTEDLNKVDEWKNFGNENAKKDFLKLITTKSDVFSIYVTARPTTGRGANVSKGADAFGIATTLPGDVDENDMPGGIVKRVRQVVWRRAAKSSVVLLPVLVREERFDRKVMAIDFPIDPSTGRPQTR